MVYVAKMIIYHAFWKLLHVLILKNKRRQTCTFVITTYNIHLQLSKKKMQAFKRLVWRLFLNRLIKKKNYYEILFCEIIHVYRYYISFYCQSRLDCEEIYWCISAICLKPVLWRICKEQNNHHVTCLRRSE